jgi:hypothetical protein
MSLGSSKGSASLSDAKIRALRAPESGQIEYVDAVVPGLRLRIGVSGAKSFVLRKRVAGKYRNITLGRYSERLPLSEARKKARQILSDVEIKADPVACLPKPQKRTAAGHTINSLWPAYKKAKAHLRGATEIERVFKRHILPEFGDRAADGITRSEITRFIDEIAQRAPVMRAMSWPTFRHSTDGRYRVSTGCPATPAGTRGGRPSRSRASVSYRTRRLAYSGTCLKRRGRRSGPRSSYSC